MSRDSCDSPTPDCGQSNISNSPVNATTATTSGRFTPSGTDDSSRAKLQRQQHQQPSTTASVFNPMAQHHADSVNRQPMIAQQGQQSRQMSMISSSTSGLDVPLADSRSSDCLQPEEVLTKCNSDNRLLQTSGDSQTIIDASPARSYCPPPPLSKMAASPDDDLQRHHPHLQQQLQQQMQNAFYSGNCYGQAAAANSNFYAQQQQQHMQQQNAAVATWAENQLAVATAGNYFRSVPDYGYSSLVGNATSSSIAGRATVEYRPTNSNSGGSRAAGSSGFQQSPGAGGFTSGPSSFVDGGDYSSFYGSSYRSATAAAAHLYKQDF